MAFGSASTSGRDVNPKLSMSLGYTVLFCYRYRPNLQVLKQIFENTEWTFLGTGTGNGGLRDLGLLADRPPTIPVPRLAMLIADVQLRDMRGYTLVEQVRAAPEMTGLPCAILSETYHTFLKKGSGAGSSKPHILVIEGNREYAKGIQKVLKAEVIRCKSPAEAVDFLESLEMSKVKMVIADVGMLGNELEGYGLLNNIREIANVPVVATIAPDVTDLAITQRIILEGATIVAVMPFVHLYTLLMMPML